MVSWSRGLTYHRRLFLWLLAYSWLMVLCFVAFQYHRERHFKAEQLNVQLQHVNESLLSDIDSTGRIGNHAVLPTINGLRVSVIDMQGRLVYDNWPDSLPVTSHLKREEIAEAMRQGSGYTVRRHSLSTGETYFYSARRGKDFIVRTAVPYSVSLNVLLRADYGFLWFMIGVTAAMSLLGYFATRRVGLHISRLRSFAEMAERGERIYDTEPFPHDELGDISGNIVRLYAHLQEAINERDHQHRLAMHQEQEKIRIKKQLTNNINHELKTPLAAMRICLETLLEHKDMPQEKREEFLTRCHAHSERLKNLLDDISLITRMDDGGEAITRHSIDLQEVITEAFSECMPMAQQRGVSLNNSIHTPLPLTGNATLLASVFHNLLNNALVYSGCTCIDIRLLASDSRSISISFSDNGCGVAPEHLPRLFERFYRVDKGRSRQAGGTGLGLAIVKNAVLWHGGDISVENRPGGGLDFHITFKREPLT